MGIDYYSLNGPRAACKLAKQLHRLRSRNFPPSWGFRMFVNWVPMCVERIGLDQKIENYTSFCFLHANNCFDNFWGPSNRFGAPKSQPPEPHEPHLEVGPPRYCAVQQSVIIDCFFPKQSDQIICFLKNNPKQSIVFKTNRLPFLV